MHPTDSVKTISGANRWRDKTAEEDRRMRMSSYGYQRPGALITGQVNREYFSRLMEICGVCNPRMTGALEQVLVFRKSRMEACTGYGVATSYFSIKVCQLQSVSILIQEMFPCSQGLGEPMHVRGEVRGREGDIGAPATVLISSSSDTLDLLSPVPYSTVIQINDGTENPAYIENTIQGKVSIRLTSAPAGKHTIIV